MSEDADTDGPEFEVWNHLSSGIDMAEMELRVLDPEDRARIEKAAKMLVDARLQLAHESGSVGSKVLFVDDILLADPWVKFVADIRVAELGVDRAHRALRRYLAVRPVVAQRPVPQRAARYVEEVVNTFAFGFDAACIALCGSALEQVLKERLLEEKVYTEPQIRREQPTAATLVAKAKAAGVLHGGATAADRLVKRRNTVLHQFVFDEKVIERQTLDSIEDLLTVMAETLGSDAA